MIQGIMQIKQGVMVFANSTLQYLLGFFLILRLVFLCISARRLTQLFGYFVVAQRLKRSDNLTPPRCFFLLESLFLLTILRLSSMSK